MKIVKLFLVIFFVHTLLLFSQSDKWYPIGGPNGGSAMCVLAQGNNDIYTIVDSDLYISRNAGDSWTKVEGQLPYLQFNSCLAADTKGNILLGTINDVYISSDKGENWRKTYVTQGRIYSICADSSGNYYVGTDAGFFRSQNSGNTWELKSIGLAYQDIRTTQIDKKGYIFVCDAYKNIYLSNNKGESWKKISLNLSANYYSQMIIDQNNSIIVLSWDSIYKTSNYGNSWTAIPKPEPNELGISPGLQYIFIVDDQTYLLGTQEGLYRSTDRGQNWILLENSTFNPNVKILTGSGNYIYAATMYTGMYRSSDKGLNWEEINNGIKNSQINTLSFDKNLNILAGLTGQGIYKTYNGGQNWVRKNAGIKSYYINSLVLCQNGFLFATFYDGNIYRSTDDGENWMVIGTNTFHCEVGHQDVLLISRSDGIFKSSDYGDTWTSINTGLEHASFTTIKIDPQGNLYALKSNDVYKSTDSGVNWTKINYQFPSSILAMEVNERNGDVYVCMNQAIYRSKDGGENWDKINNNLPPYLGDIQSIHITKNGYLFTGPSGVYQSRNDGDLWVPEVFKYGGVNVRAFLSDEFGHVYAGINGEIYKGEIKSLTLNLPGIGDTLQAESVQKIKWSFTGGISKINILFSPDQNTYWSTIANNISVDDSEYNWLVPKINSNTCRIKIVDSEDNYNSDQISSGLVIFVPKPNVPNIINPNNNENVPILNLIAWSKTQFADYYSFQVSEDSSFLSISAEYNGINETTLIVGPLKNDTRYYYRIKAHNISGVSAWSEFKSFKTIIAAPEKCILFSPNDYALNQEINQIFTWHRAKRAETYHFQLAADQNFTMIVVDDSILSDTTKIHTLQHGTKYYWRVRAKNIGGYGFWSDHYTFTSIVEKPELPVLVYPHNNTSNIFPEPVLKWNKTPRAEYYIVQVSSDSGFNEIVFNDSSVADSNKKISKLLYQTPYYWRIKAVNMGGFSEWSPVWKFTTIIAPPSSPVQLNPLNNAENLPVEVQLTWNKIPDCERYYIQVSASNDFTENYINDSTYIDTLCNLTELKNNYKYFWRVRASNIGGNSPWSEVWSFSTIVAKPGVPVLISPENGSTNQQLKLNFNWTPSSDVASYKFKLYKWITERPQVTKTLVIDDSTMTTVHKELEGLEQGTKYDWMVIARNFAGADSSFVWNFTTLLAAPSELKALAESGNVELNWIDNSENESGFIIERNKDSEPGYKVIDSISANITFFKDSTTDFSTSYNYRIRTYNYFTSSAYSNEANITLTAICNENNLPVFYDVFQNYPNPFNPSTKIQYSLPYESEVRLMVFSSLGEVVAELVNKIEQPGNKEVVFESENLSSGIYFYTIYLKAVNGNEEFFRTKKLILLK